MLKITEIEELRFRRFQEGDSRAFEFFFKKYHDSIIGFSKQFVFDEEIARNVAQEAFVKLWVCRKRIHSVDSIQSFLYKGVKNQCLNWLRHEKVRQKYTSFCLQERENSLNIEVLNSFEFDTMTIKELEQLIEKSISDMPEKCKIVFLKRRFENKKNKEIANELGISLKAVEANMTRALKFLNLKLANYLTILSLLTYIYLK